MSRQSDDGRHEGWIAAVFADGMYGGSGRLGVVTASNAADGTMLEVDDWQDRSDAEVVGWRPTCNDNTHRGRECWRGQLWTRVTDPAERDPARRKLYSEDADLSQADDDLLMREWDAHMRPFAGTYEVELAARAVDEAQDWLTEKVRSSRAQGATWEAIGRSAGMTRQAAHERWAAVTAG